VIANTGDDVEALGVHVSPDPDLCTYWLCDEIDEERGWGIRDDTFTVFERLRRLGAPDWFGLTDRDLATCLERRRRLDAGERPTTIARDLAQALGARATVLPMCDEPVRTRIRTPAGWNGFQEYFIRERALPEIEEIELDGIDAATATPEALAALAAAEAIVIGPSNPVISIGPIISMPAMRDAIAASPAPAMAVSPYVAGQVVKGPTDIFMQAIGRPSTAAGVASLYEGLIAGMVCDPEDPDPAPQGVRVLSCPTLMEGAPGRRELAERTLEFASTLAVRG
jgi:LPPG:FO 2-phospho-L-lactate transferase